MAFLKINGVDISPYIQTMSITHEPVWSTNAGRTLDATFVGDIKARKWKINLTTRPLNQKESGEIMELLESGSFFNVTFIPTNNKSESTITIPMYSNGPSHTVYSYNQQFRRYQSLAFDIIEQ